jgi:hypothetical protein
LKITDLETVSSSSGSTDSGSISADENGGSNESGQPSNPEQKSNTGAIAGGTVGGVLVVIAAVVGYFVYRRRKHKAKLKDSGATSESNRAELEAKERLEAQEVHGKSHPPELDGNPRSELSGGWPSEIDGNPRAELEGGWQGHEFREAASPTEQRGP